MLHIEESIVLTARGSNEVRSEAVGLGMALRNLRNPIFSLFYVPWLNLSSPTSHIVIFS